MIDMISKSKYNKIIAALLVVVMALFFCISFSASNVFAKTHGSDIVEQVFFYAGDKNGDSVYISSANMEELKAEAHGNSVTGGNYYATLIDQLPTVNYIEGKGLTFDEFVTFMSDKSAVVGSDRISFDAQDADGNRLTFYSNDGGSKSGTVKQLCKTKRYYFPTLKDNFVAVDMMVKNHQAVINEGLEMPAYLAVESYGDRVGNLATEIAANGGNLTGCLKNKLDTENALRLIKPMTLAELGDENTEATSTANDSFKWIYNVGLRYADNADSPITSQGNVAAPECKMLLDNNNTLKVTFSCATAGAEIYHSLKVDGEDVYVTKAPQYKYDGKAIEIPNFNPQQIITISYMAVKQGYTDAGVQKITSDKYQSAEDENEPNFTYALKADKTQLEVNEKLDIKACLTANKSADVYGMQYRVKIPAANFAINEVKVEAGWQYQNVRVGDNQVLTFINMRQGDTAPMTATKLTANQTLNFATITLKLITAGNLSVIGDDMAITKADGVKYANVTGENLTLTVKADAAQSGNKIWNGTEDHSWYNRTATVFHIKTPEQLAGLAYIVNQGDKLTLPGETQPQREAFTDKTIYLDNDIYLNKQKYVGMDDNALQWTSIAGGVAVDNDAIFDGTFDGQGHTVFNMYIYKPNLSGNPKDAEINNHGLFGITAEKAVIQNLTVQDGYIESGRQLGAIVGKTGCLQANGFDADRADGHGTTIFNCNNINTIIKGSDSKGIGGIVGAAWNHCVITYCTNSGSITNTGGFEAGGIAGTCEGTVSYCTNNGEIYGSNAGGIVGSTQDSAALVEYCINKGEVSGNYSGGIAGFLQSGSINNCVNVGTVTGSTAGAIIADLRSSKTQSNNYYLDGSAPAGIAKGTATGDNSAVSKTAAEMKSADLINELGGGFVQGSDGFPVTLEYKVVAKASSAQVAPDGSFDVVISVNTNSNASVNFKGAQVAVSYDKSLVSLDDIVKADGVECVDNNGILNISFSGGTKNIGVNGCTLVTLKCKALNINGQAIFAVNSAKITNAASNEVMAKVDNTTVNIKTASVGGGGGGGAVDVSVEPPVIDNDPVTQTGKFIDVAANHWAATYINKMADNGIINGKTANTFAPNDAITRAEFAAILSRMSGETLPAAGNTFADVADSAWYAQNVAWAVNAGITNGITATTFAPNAQISRQEMAVMIMRYVEHKDKALQENTAAITFADDAKIAAYAKDAVSAMQKAGIIAGKENNMFAPADSATRAEAAKMLGVLWEQLG